MAEKKQEEKAPETRYYWAPAKKYQMGNWVKEVRAQNGMIVTPEQSLVIPEHVLISDDPAVWKFVENHHAFKKGQVVRVKDLDEANLMTARHNGARRETRLKDEVNDINTPEQSNKMLVETTTVVAGS